MTLIATTDVLFQSVVLALKDVNAASRIFMKSLEDTDVGNANNQLEIFKSSIIFADTYDSFLNSDSLEDIRKFLSENNRIYSAIEKRYSENELFTDPIVLYIYWALKNQMYSFLEKWPLIEDYLHGIATDLVVKIQDC
ncbi:hypothetical protein N9W78_01905 [bacterium]|nr:hypothetical protein [bacterium]